MTALKLKNIYTISGIITTKTGLRIGGSESGMHIGGVDNPIIRDAHTGQPYIPGSSLKGKIRSLLEQASGYIGDSRGGAFDAKMYKNIQGNGKEFVLMILKAFGVSGSDVHDFGPTRLAFADAMLDEEYAKSVIERDNEFIEIKTETSIDRIRGTAQSPRQTERVVRGAKFRFRITFRDLMDGDIEILKKIVLPGLKLLSLDALGGSISRGYGSIEISIDDGCTIGNDKVKDLYKAIEDPFKSLPASR